VRKEGRDVVHRRLQVNQATRAILSTLVKCCRNWNLMVINDSMTMGGANDDDGRDEF
jgi:hypothetical protein